MIFDGALLRCLGCVAALALAGECAGLSEPAPRSTASEYLLTVGPNSAGAQQVVVDPTEGVLVETSRAG